MDLKAAMQKHINDSYPTEERMINVAAGWWENHKGINFLDWNKELIENTIPFEICHFDRKFVENYFGVMDGKYKFEDLVNDLYKILIPALNKFNCKDKFFLKLISRSPKDSMNIDRETGKPKPFESVTDAVNSLLSSMRIFDDISLVSRIETPCFVVRPYINFPAYKEWRVFIKNKTVIGISQYYYNTKFTELTKEEIEFALSEIQKIITEVAIPNFALENYVVDVIVGDKNRKTILLEANPYGLSDPCLYYSYDALENSDIEYLVKE